MKKTQITDVLRNIRKQIVSYISIIVIAVLGVSIYLGLDYSAAAVRQNGSDYFEAQNYRDVELVSTLLFTREDLDALRNTEGVADVEEVWQVGARASFGGDSRDVNAISLTQRLNLTQIVEGRLPETDTECAVEQKLAEEMGLRVGSELLLQDASGETAQILRGERFTVTGIANHPDHNNTMVADTYYVLLTPAAFDTSALDGCFMKAELAIEKEAPVDRYDDAYTTSLASVEARLEELALSRAAMRDAEVREQSRSEIDAGQRELDEAQTELNDARIELDEGWAALADGEQELLDGQAELDEAERELTDAEEQLADAKERLDETKTQLEDAGSQMDNAEYRLAVAGRELADGKAELEAGWNELETAKGSVRDGIRSAVENALGDSAGSVSWAGYMSANVDSSDVSAMPFWITSDYCCDMSLSLGANVSAFVYSGAITDEMLLEGYILSTGSAEGFDADSARAALAYAAIQAAGTYDGQYRELQDGCKQWDQGHAQYLAGLDDYRAGQERYYNGLAEYEDGLRQYEEGCAAYEEGLAQFQEAKARYEQGLQDLADGETELEEARARLESAEVEYDEGLLQLDDGARQLEDARRQLDSLDPCRWLILGMSGNAGYVQLKMAGKNLEDMESTFALLFVLVGALVIFATVSKMVDEQRTQVGTTKALGFFNREIFFKYLSFGVSAALLGTVLGTLAARFALEGFVLRGYGIYYTFDFSRFGATAVPTIAVLLASAGLAGIAVWAVCSRLLRTPAIRLLQAKVPEGAKKTEAGKGHALSLYSRLILLNIRTDIKRVIVTIVSVAGCCALVVIGVTLKTAMIGSLDRQYVEIEDYDWRLSFSPEDSEAAGEEIEALLREAGADYAPLNIANITYRFGDIQTAELFCGDVEEIGKLYRFCDWKTGEPLTDSDEGILIQRRVAEQFGLEPGSEFEIALGGTRAATVSVAGIFDHYIGRPMVMSPTYYERVFGESCEPNAYFVRLNGAEEDVLMEALRAIEGFAGATSSEAGRAVFEASVGVVDSLVALFIFMSAVMAGVVLLNLTSIYVLQKKRELTIMRINGFTVREVVGYMLRETVITTTLGILVGMAVGSGIGYKICRSLEQPFLQIVKSLSLPAWLAGAALTVLFTVLVNIIALRPVKNLKLTDVA